MKQLIVNADDFGLHESINEAVEEAYREGILTSASLASCGKAFLQAVEVAKKNKGLGVGIHLVLNGEKPLSPIDKIPTLVGPDGLLFESHGDFCKKILKGEILLEQVAYELEAQIDRFFEAGLVPTHIDSHRHMHLFWPVFKKLSPILKRKKINKIRRLNVPASDMRGMNIKGVFFLLLARYAGILKAKDYRSADYYLGFFQSGKMDKKYLKAALRRLAPGSTEINFHPGKDDFLIGSSYAVWSRVHKWPNNWERELRLLLDPELKEIIRRNGISLINYSDLC